MKFSFFRAPGRLLTPSRESPAPVARPAVRAHFYRSARRFNEKLARGAGLAHPYNRTLRRQGSLKAPPSLRKGAAGPTPTIPRRRAFMPGGMQSVASMSASTVIPGGPSDPVAEPPTAPPATMAGPAWMPGGFQPIAAPSFMEAEATIVLPGSESFFHRPSEQYPYEITDNDDKIFRRQMAVMMKAHHIKKGLMEHRDEVERIVAERKREAEMERRSRTRKEHARLVEERLARQEAERLEIERLRREEAQRVEMERLHQERLAREAAEREARRLEEERQRREAEERARAEQARLAAAKAERERAEKAAEDPLQHAFFVYEGKWKELKNGLSPNFRKLRATELPWPVFFNVAEPADITEARVAEFLLHPARPEAQGKARRLVLKLEVVRWHPDRFDTKVLPVMAEDEQEKTPEIAGHVTRILTKLMNTS